MKASANLVGIFLALYVVICAASSEGGMERRLMIPNPAPGIGDGNGFAPHIAGDGGVQQTSSGNPPANTEASGEKHPNGSHTGSDEPSSTGGNGGSSSHPDGGDNHPSSTPAPSSTSTSGSSSSSNTDSNGTSMPDPIGTAIATGASIVGVFGGAIGNVAGNISTFVDGLPTWSAGTPSPTATAAKNSKNAAVAATAPATAHLVVLGVAMSVCLAAGLATTLL